MTEKLRKLIYKIDPNAQFRNAMTSVQGNSFDIIQNPTNSWSFLINPYSDSVATLMNNAFFIFDFSVKIAESKSIRFSNNMILNGIQTFSFSQGEQSIFTLSSANPGRSIPLYATYNKLNDFNQESIYQVSQLQDNTFITKVGYDFEATSKTEIQNWVRPLNYNPGRLYFGLPNQSFYDTVAISLADLAPTSEPLSLSKGIINIVINFSFFKDGYLNLLAEQKAEDLLEFKINKANFYYTQVIFTTPIPRPLTIKPLRVIINKYSGEQTIEIQEGLNVSPPLIFNGATMQLSPGKLIKFCIFPQITSCNTDITYNMPDPYNYDFESRHLLPNKNNNNLSALIGNNQSLISCLSDCFSIQNVKITADGGQSYLPSNSPSIYPLAASFGGMANYIYSFLMNQGYGTTGDYPKSILEYNMYRKYFQCISVNCADTVNIGYNSQIVSSFEIYPCANFSKGGTVTMSFDYLIISVDN